MELKQLSKECRSTMIKSRAHRKSLQCLKAVVPFRVTLREGKIDFRVFYLRSVNVRLLIQANYRTEIV